ncbi:MAG: hypothetical protein ACOYJZ_00665 [Acutalibacter sp.]|jgi:hypothetical protein
MEAYKKRLQRQNVLLAAGIGLLVVLDVIVGVFWDRLGLDSRIMSDRARTMQSILVFGGMVYCLGRLVQNRRKLKDPTRLEEESRIQGDERRILVGEKAAKLSGDLLLVGLVVAVFVSSLYNMDAFNALYYTLWGCVALRVGCWLYVRRKY